MSLTPMPSSDQAAAAIIGRTLALPAVVEAAGEWVEDDYRAPPS